VDRLAPVSNLDPSIRLVCLALISSAALLAGGLFALMLAAIMLVFLIRAGTARLALIRDASSIAIFALFSGAMRYLGTSQVHYWPALLIGIGSYGARLLAVVLSSRLFYVSTSISQIRDAATRIARHIPILRRIDVGLGLSLVIGFIPMIFAEWAASLEAARSRSMPRKPSIARQAVFLSAFLRRLMLRAVYVPESLLARGWSKDRGISELEWKAADAIALALCILTLIAAALRLV
jgi:energy-coupling factor transporter transmembrane protein EcfT